jgi:hypothetical protein
MAIMLNLTDDVNGFPLRNMLTPYYPRLKLSDSIALRSTSFTTVLGIAYALKLSMRNLSNMKEKIYGNHPYYCCSVFTVRRWWLLLVEAGPLDTW